MHAHTRHTVPGIRQDSELYDPGQHTDRSTPPPGRDWITQHPTQFYAILGGVLGMILVVCLYILWRGPHRNMFICCRRHKAVEDGGVNQVLSVGIWGGKGAAAVFPRPGVYLTDLKRQAGSSSVKDLHSNIQIHPVLSSFNVEKGLVKGSAQIKTGPTIIDCGMSGVPLPGPEISSNQSVPASPPASTYTFRAFTPGRGDPINTTVPNSPSPQSPIPRTPASKLAKDWKRDDEKKRRDTTVTKKSSGSSFGQSYPLNGAAGSYTGSRTSLDSLNRDSGGVRLASPFLASSKPVIRPLDSPRLPHNHPPPLPQQRADASLDFYTPRDRLADQRAVLPPPKSRRPPTNFSFETGSTPSMYSTSTPAQSMYIPTSNNNHISTQKHTGSIASSYAGQSAGSVPLPQSDKQDP
ncbi:hypothetical protein BD324DRAFT_624922 [Kockovaella imperatae]|uniref:Uncharacterized protein n=1 Tax=Kockovaella imperatae TaxID=4999 RepID=A0A1Y1UJ48_9TREE|nr:hypothetical protein BD324DRAFT_624922 [Kockovaella imperatae]ORX37135.1 hypothetical protein BD324DRAFT_624922 [Kockovaella imperatae]